ncbi:MAG TPA: DEAD/DEAH box helicase [Steroidobacteraceae bacterium]|nr:DEAD/DEAH box helicase [Steroidobacteraceae bacterium]
MHGTLTQSRVFYDAPRNLAIYDAPEHFARVQSTIPEARVVSARHIAMPLSVHSNQICRWLGLPALPILDLWKYDWPGKYKPFEAQRVTANFLAANPRAFVLSDMGTGKTLAALWAADFVLACNPGMRCLIVAPLSTLQRVWADEIFRNFMGRRSCVIVHGSREKRIKALNTPADFYIINYDGLHVVGEHLALRPDIQLVLVDEASAYRDFSTSRHKRARKLFDRQYLWMMTGTPTPNGPVDAYGIALLVNRAKGLTFTSYKHRVMTQVSRFVWVPRVGSQKEAYELMQPAVRFKISDCVDLPPCTVQLRDVELSAEQAKSYTELRRQCTVMLKQNQITPANEAVLRFKLIQMSAGAVYSGSGALRETNKLDCAPRIAALREVMSQCNEKIIVFAGLTSILDMLYEDLSKDYSCRVINGAVSNKVRSETFAAFEQAADPRVLIADPATMAHGLTLTAATAIVWFSPTDRTELYLQANKRIDRPGQTKATTIIQLAATAIEREIYKRLANNENMQGLVLKLARGEL